jgi:plasmid stability protein
MSVITIHALEPTVEKRIRARARQQHKSLNQTVKELLAECVGVKAQAAPDQRADFAEFAGAWTDGEARMFATTTADLANVNAEDWQ